TRPPRMPTLRTESRPDAGSITRPFAITRSYVGARPQAMSSDAVSRLFTRLATIIVSLLGGGNCGRLADLVLSLCGSGSKNRIAEKHDRMHRAARGSLHDLLPARHTRCGDDGV